MPEQSETALHRQSMLRSGFNNARTMTSASAAATSTGNAGMTATAASGGGPAVAPTAVSALTDNELEDLEEFPLALEPTPHFLRRFNYNAEGSIRTFSEPHNAGALTEHRLRALRGNSLIPKRRANDLTLPPRKRLADEHDHTDSDAWQTPAASTAAGEWEYSPPFVSRSAADELNYRNDSAVHTRARVPVAAGAHVSVPTTALASVITAGATTTGTTTATGAVTGAGPGVAGDINGFAGGASRVRSDHGLSPSPSAYNTTAVNGTGVAITNSGIMGSVGIAGAASGGSQSPGDDRFHLLSPTASPRDEQVNSGDDFGGVDRLGPRISSLEVTRANLHNGGNAGTALLQQYGDATAALDPPTAGGIPLSTSGDDLAARVGLIVDEFERLPSELHRYALYCLFRGCNRRTLSTMVPILTSALRNDILSRLPTELADMCLSYLDSKSLCAVSQVCRTWYKLVEENESLWKDLLESDSLNPTQLDLERAQHEGWGYHGWTNERVAATQPPVNAFGRPVNIYKAVYRRLYVISKNWMSLDHSPRHLSIPCLAQDVITCLEFDKDRIIAGSDRKHINIYDTRTGRLIHHFSDHDGGVWALKYVNHDTLVTGSTDRTIRVWSISKARCTHLFRGHGSTVRCLDIVMPVESVDPVSGAKSMTPPCPMIVSGSRDATLRLWRLPGADDPDFFSSGPDDADPYFERMFVGHANPVRAISAHGDTIVSGSYDTTVRVWRLSTGECRWELTGHNNKVYSAVIDAKRNRCISASMDWNVKVWCIETGSLLFTLEGHTSLVGLLDLSRTTLVSAAADSTLRVWDPETGMLLHKLVGHQGPISCFQHDESKVISGSEKKLKLWNIRTGELVGDLLNSLQLTSIWQVGFDSRRCISAVARNDGCSYLEVLDFDYDPHNPPNSTVEISEVQPENDTIMQDSMMDVDSGQ